MGTRRINLTRQPGVKGKLVRSEESLDKIEEYLNGGFKEDGSVFPTKSGLALYLNIDTQALSNWALQNAAVANALRVLENYQEHTLVNKGLDGTFTSNIVKMMLASHYGYHETMHTDITSKGEAINKGRTLDDFYAEDKGEECTG